MSRIKKSDIWQFLRFCVVGSLNAIIDFAVLDLFLWMYPTTSTEKILFYNSLAVLLASTNSFFCNKYWTFQQRQSITLSEVLRFIMVAGATAGMNDTLLLLLSKVFPDVMSSTLIGANAIKLAAIIGTMSISFFGMRLLVFFKRGRVGNIEHTMLTTSLVTAAVHISELPTVRVKAQRAMKTLIIIPTYNEYENLSLLLHGIFTHAPDTDVLIVDDNSPDGTGELADKTATSNARVHVLHRPGKLGLGTAYIAGFKYAIQHGYDAAFEMDADFSHDPRYLPNFLKAIEQADLVIGSRYITGGSTPNWSLLRRLISGSGNVFARLLLQIPVHDCTGGFRCYRCKVLQSISLDDIQSRGYAFQIELTYRVLKQNFKIAEIPITFIDRRLGTSKMSRKIVIEAFLYVLRAYFSKQNFTSRANAATRSSFMQETNSRSRENLISQSIVPVTYASTNISTVPKTPLSTLSIPTTPILDEYSPEVISALAQTHEQIFLTLSEVQLKSSRDIRCVNYTVKMTFVHKEVIGNPTFF